MVHKSSTRHEYLAPASLASGNRCGHEGLCIAAIVERASVGTRVGKQPAMLLYSARTR